MNNIIAVVGVTSGLLTIIGFFIPINSIRARWLHAAYILVVALVVSFATYQSTKLARINDVSRAADRLVAGPPLSAALAASDDFESGTLASWGTEVNGAGGWFVYMGRLHRSPLRAISTCRSTSQIHHRASSPR